jgi:hypothetical protein
MSVSAVPETTNRPLGPNVKKLIAQLMASLAIPPGGDFYDGVQAIMTPGKLGEHFKIAMAQAFSYIDAMKAAHDNPYGNDDETIAEAMVKAVKQRQEERMARFRK